MAKRLTTELSDDEVLRVARAKVSESAASTYTETSIDTQLSVERGVIWMINFIEFHFEDIDLLSEVGANAFDFIKAQVTRESKSEIVEPDDVDCVQMAELRIGRSAAIGTDSGPLWFQHERPMRIDFPTPMPFASSSMFFGIKGSDATGTHDVGFRVGYTIRAVTDKYFFRVASALLG